MNRLKQWCIDVGFWRAETPEDWEWALENARLTFWNTPTNKVHRTYRNLIAELVLKHVRELREAYEQGARDGALQYAEHLRLMESDGPPENFYQH